MPTRSPIALHRDATYKLARSLKWKAVYSWLLERGYFPESYVLPPCFSVVKIPKNPKMFYKVTKKGKTYYVDQSECVKVHYPKSELTDRTFGVMHPYIHNDIAYHIARNWLSLVDAMIPKGSLVTSYSFPVPINSRYPGRVGYLRSGRMIYEFIAMTDDDLASVAYKYSYLVRTDIKNFYPSVYTHSIAWALHGKKFIRKPANLHNFRHLGNRLDRLFQYSNDRCTNGLAIGPVVSDIAAEVVASSVDSAFSQLLVAKQVECEAVRFKDDYRILVRSESDAKTVIKLLQAALKEYNLELSDEKTRISTLPDGLFREWVSRYHAAHPNKRKRYSWKQFRELYLAVIEIDRACPGTGVVDRYLSDIVSSKGNLKLSVGTFNLEKVISMLLMLATLRVKAFPKIMAILESVLRSFFGSLHQGLIVEYLEGYLKKLSIDEERNKYLISWICYFLVSNNLEGSLSFRPKFKDPVTRSIFNNRGAIFKECKEFKLFVGCKKAGHSISMFQHLDIFNPPRP